MYVTARSLAESMRNLARHKEASCLLLEYTDDYDTTLEILIEGEEWTDALRLVCDVSYSSSFTSSLLLLVCKDVNYSSLGECSYSCVYSIYIKITNNN